MYIGQPEDGHGLRQAIARVNRIFRDKPAGLAVDYIGIAQRPGGNSNPLSRPHLGTSWVANVMVGKI